MPKNWQASLRTFLEARIEELVLGLICQTGLDLLHHLHSLKRREGHQFRLEGPQFRLDFLVSFAAGVTFNPKPTL